LLLVVGRVALWFVGCEVVFDAGGCGTLLLAAGRDSLVVGRVSLLVVGRVSWLVVGRVALLVVGRGGVFVAGGCGTLFFAVGRSALLVAGRDSLAGLPGRALAALFAVFGRVAGTSTGRLVAFTTPGPLNDPGLAVAATGGCPWLTDARSD
jgi:hypothetical protein